MGHSSLPQLVDLQPIPAEPRDSAPIIPQNWMERAALMMLAEIPFAEIASQTGKTFDTIAALPGLPEFRRIIHSFGTDPEVTAKKLLRQSVADSVLVLMEIRFNRTIKPEVRAKAAMYLIDQSLGKAVEKTKKTATDTPAEEILDNTVEGLSPEEQVQRDLQLLLEQNPQLRHQFGLTN